MASTLEKIGLAIAGAYAGSYFFPETFYSLSGGLLGQSAAGEVGSIALQNFTQPDLASTAAQNAAFNAQAVGGVEAASSIAGAAPVDVNSGFSFADTFTNPTVLTGLLAGGASLGSSLLQTQAAEDARAEQREENALNREHSATEAEKSREHQASLSRELAALRAEEAAKTRRFQAALQTLAQKDAIRRQRAQAALQGSGSSLAQNVANIRGALLS